MPSNDSITIHYGRVPKATLARCQFTVTDHEGLALIHTLGGDPAVVRLLIATDRMDEWELLLPILQEKFRLELLDKETALSLLPG